MLLSAALEGIEHPSDEYAVVNKTSIDFQKFENDATIEGMEKGFLSLLSLSLSLSLSVNLSCTTINAYVLFTASFFLVRLKGLFKGF